MLITDLNSQAESQEYKSMYMYCPKYNGGITFYYNVAVDAVIVMILDMLCT